MNKLAGKKLKKTELRKYAAMWQNNEYKTNPEYREMKIKNAVEWRKKNLEKYRKYQREYQKKTKRTN